MIGWTRKVKEDTEGEEGRTEVPGEELVSADLWLLEGLTCCELPELRGSAIDARVPARKGGRDLIFYGKGEIRCEVGVVTLSVDFKGKEGEDGAITIQ